MLADVAPRQVLCLSWGRHPVERAADDYPYVEDPGPRRLHHRRSRINKKRLGENLRGIVTGKRVADKN